MSAQTPSASGGLFACSSLSNRSLVFLNSASTRAMVEEIPIQIVANHTVSVLLNTKYNPTARKKILQSTSQFTFARYSLSMSHSLLNVGLSVAEDEQNVNQGGE